MLDLITAADFYFYTLLNKSSLKFENKGKWNMPDSCVSKEVSYSLSANLQVIISLQARKRTQNVRQPFPVMKLTLIKKETKNHFWLRHLENTLIESQQQCSLTIAYDNLKYTEVYKSDAKTLHGVIIFRIVDGNYIYIYMNFSCTEACGSKMKTTALCVFALFLSSMLVEGGMVNYKCLPSGNCKRAKVHE